MTKKILVLLAVALFGVAAWADIAINIVPMTAVRNVWAIRDMRASPLAIKLVPLISTFLILAKWGFSQPNFKQDADTC